MYLDTALGIMKLVIHKRTLRVLKIYSWGLALKALYSEAVTSRSAGAMCTQFPLPSSMRSVLAFTCLVITVISLNIHPF